MDTIHPLILQIVVFLMVLSKIKLFFFFYFELIIYLLFPIYPYDNGSTLYITIHSARGTTQTQEVEASTVTLKQQNFIFRAFLTKDKKSLIIFNA